VLVQQIIPLTGHSPSPPQVTVGPTQSPEPSQNADALDAGSESSQVFVTGASV
jgi:hypothetical protein